VPANLRCPDPPPQKREYNRYFLDANVWPTPDSGVASPHFWLTKPLPGGGRLLTNQWFPYGYDANSYLLHNGTDVAEDLGTPVLAAGEGTVVVAGPDLAVLYGWRCDWYGNLVVIELDQQWNGQPVFVLYGHVLNIVVEPGERVFTGQQVAEIGFGGVALVPHLHLEIRIGENTFNATRNPLLWYGPGSTRGVIAGRLLDPLGRPWQGVGISAVNLTDGTGAVINTWSYMNDPSVRINPDEALAENFLFSDLPPGEYRVVTLVQGVEYQATVTVNAGEISTVALITEPYRPVEDGDG
jgi:murein DD-endopeptidase MepM/ murein hydrolase activator NlpD